MTIKQATLDDVAVISRIHALSWKAAYQGVVPQSYLDDLQEDFWVSAFSQWIGRSVMSVQLIYDGQIPVGCAAYGRSRDETLPDWGELVSLYLLPEYFGKGYGDALMQQVLADLSQKGYTSVYLWVLEHNQRARRFYEKCGFVCNHDRYSFEILNQPLTDVRYVYHSNPQHA